MLIIGANSKIGGAIARMLKNEQHDDSVVSTTRKANTSCPDDHLLLDLSDPSTFSSIRGRTFGIVFFCAGVTDTLMCKDEWKKTHSINVDATLQITEELLANQNHIVFFSSNLVYDGEEPYPDHSSKTNPKTAYGKQKAELEIELLNFKSSVSIIRLTKVVSGGYPLFEKWNSLIGQNKRITAFEDWLFSPISLHDVCKLSLEIAESRFRGIANVSAPDDISYADAALLLIEQRCGDTALLERISVNDSPFSPEWIPKHSTLKSEYNLPEAKQCLEEVFELLPKTHAFNQSHG